MRPIFPAILFAATAAAFSSEALAEWDDAYGGYEDAPITSGRPLPAYDAQRSGAYSSPIRQVSTISPPQPAVNYQTPAIPDYLPQTRAQAQNVQLYGTLSGTPIAAQVYAQPQPLYATQPVASYYGQPQPASQAYYTQQQTAAAYPAPAYQVPAAYPAATSYPAPPQQYAQAYTIQQSTAAQTYAQPQAQAYAQPQASYQADPYYQQTYAQPYSQQAYAQPQYGQSQWGQPQPYASPAYAYDPQTAPRAEGDSDDGPSFASEPKRRAQGFYLALKSGITIPQNVDLTFAGAPGTAEYKTGWGLATAFGYSFAPWASWVAPRAEGEFRYLRNSIDSFTLSGTKFSDPVVFGDVTSLNFMANGYTDFYLSRYFQPYLVAGFGMGYLDFDRQGINSTGVLIDNDSTGFAWQVGSGFSLPVGGGTVFDVGYRFLQTTGLSLTSAAGTKNDIDVNNHIIELGFRVPVGF